MYPGYKAHATSQHLHVYIIGQSREFTFYCCIADIYLAYFAVSCVMDKLKEECRASGGDISGAGVKQVLCT